MAHMAEGGNGVAEAGAGSAFLSRDFRLYQTARLLVILGAEAQSVAVAWQVYQITHSALDLGLTGLALFAPGLFFMLAAGHVADRYDRRWIILVCYAVQAVCTLALLRFALHPTGQVWPIYAVLLGIGLGRAFSGPASAALLPSLVPTEALRECGDVGVDRLPDCEYCGAGGGRAAVYPAPDRSAGARGTARRRCTPSR